MIELDARFFLHATSELRAMQVLLNNLPDKTLPLGSQDKELIQQHVGRMISAIQAIGARSSYRSAERLKLALESVDACPGYVQISQALADIESRFADHLDDIMLFVVASDEVTLLGVADDLVEESGFSERFPNASLEIEEAAKCIALGRTTAAVFHSMRALECGIRALAKSLDIEDPLKPAEKNWGVVLSKIKDKIDSTWPQKTRVKDPTAAKVLNLHAHLDAVRVPWRNATMHVENVYLHHEAAHILRCVAYFLKELGSHCTESGEDPLLAQLG